MEQVTWKVEERFTFPALGVATEPKTVTVTPQWQLEYDAVSVRLVGVYHITANLGFEVSNELAFDDNTIAVDDVDFDGSTGYFEYALPFTVDLPEQAGAPRLSVENVAVTFDDSSCVIGWDVSCQYAMLQPLSAFQTEGEQGEKEQETVTNDSFENTEELTNEKYTVELAPEETAAEHNTLAEQIEEVENNSSEVMTSAPLIWDLKDTYSVKHYTLNQIVRE